MLNNYIQHIRLSLGHEIQSSVSAIQYDTAREFHFYIDDYIISDDSEIRIYIRKPSGKEIYNHCILKDNEIVVVPTTQMLAECGLNIGQIQIVKDEVILTSFSFTIEIEENYSENAIPSTNEFTILDELITEARKIAAAEADRIAAENQRIQNEENREQAESERIQNENIRVDSEFQRKENENQRIDSETDRNQSESQRIQNENERINSEDQRNENESIRNNNEQIRQENEQQRENNTTEAIKKCDEAAEKAINTTNDIKNKADNGEFTGTIQIGKVTTGEAGTPASVENVGTPKDAVLDIVIPKGEDGLQPADFVGTQQELEAAIAAGTTYEGMTVFVDDENEDNENEGSAGGGTGNLSDYYSLRGGTEITEGADLNDEAYKKIGNYYCKLISIASTLLNCPVQRAFTMKVMYGTGENYKQQLIKEYDTGNIWMRTFASNETDIAMEWVRICGDLSNLDVNATNFNFKLKKYVDTECSSHIEVLQKYWNEAFEDTGAAGAYRIVLTNFGSDNAAWTCYAYGNGLYGYAVKFSHNSVPVYCQINNGNWITNVELINDNNLYKKGIVLAGGTVIPSNADLDTYKIPGNYYCDSNVVGATIINSPTSTAFKIIVDYASGTGYVRQTYIPLLTDVYPICTRRLQDTGEWTAWKRFITEDDIINPFIKYDGHATFSIEANYSNAQDFTFNIPSGYTFWSALSPSVDDSNIYPYNVIISYPSTGKVNVRVCYQNTSNSLVKNVYMNIPVLFIKSNLYQ